jgi:hypothetical protein
MRENNGGDELNRYMVHVYGNVTTKPPVQLLYTNKMFFKTCQAHIKRK